MLLVLVLVMVVFFFLGYELHRRSFSEREQWIIEQDKVLDKSKKRHEENIADEKLYLDRKQKELEGLVANYNNRMKEFEVIRIERDKFKTIIINAQRNCKCGVLSNESR